MLTNDYGLPDHVPPGPRGFGQKLIFGLLAVIVFAYCLGIVIVVGYAAIKLFGFHIMWDGR